MVGWWVAGWIAWAAAEDLQIVLVGTDQVARVPAGAQADVVAGAEALLAGQPAVAAEAYGRAAAAFADPDLDYQVAAARYLAGELISAEQACAAALARDRGLAAALALEGMIAIDRGRTQEGLASLGRARAGTRDARLLARVALMEGQGRWDLGDGPAAAMAWEEARRRALELPDALLAAAAEAQLARARGEGAGDQLLEVSRALGRGDRAGAHRLVAALGRGTARADVTAALAAALVDRAEGRLVASLSSAMRAATTARAVGLVREEVAAWQEVAMAHTLSGQTAEAATALATAAARLEGSGLRAEVAAVAVRQGHLALLLGELDVADAALARAMAVGGRHADPTVGLRIEELVVALGAARGATDLARWQGLVAGWQRLGLAAEAGRVGADGVLALAVLGVDAAPLRAASEAAFRAAGDPLGSVHLGIAWGLGLAKRGATEPALAAFADAARGAAAVGGDLARELKEVAEGNAAELLKTFQPPSRATEVAATLGLTHVLAPQAAFVAARAAWQRGEGAFKAGDWSTARAAFAEAAAGFEAAADSDNASQAHRGLALAAIQEASVVGDAAAEQRLWLLALDAARVAADPEVVARADAGLAMAQAKAGAAGSWAALLRTAAAAEAVGLRDVAGRAWKVAVGVAPDVGSAEDAARSAWRLRPDGMGVAAVYNAALRAWDAGEAPRCLALLQLVRGRAGTLEGDVEGLWREASAR
ncbi:MAG: hypothetical protein RLZZ383_2465 [Pseudomonadota bacterium]